VGAIPPGYHGAAQRLGAADIDRVAAALGVPSRTVWAIASVEAATHGFLPDGRPELLFEAHQFHELTGGRWDSAHPNISAPYWDTSLYGAAGAHQYDRLAEAAALDHDAALQAATWGMFQVLGRNFRAVGFADVASFVAAMCTSEGAQLDAFAAYCTAESLVDFLKSSDWRDFAARYNGPGQVNAYAAKLAAAVADGKFPPPDLPPAPPAPAPVPPPPPGGPPPPMPAPQAIEIPVGLQYTPSHPIRGTWRGAVVDVLPGALVSADPAVCTVAIAEDGRVTFRALALGKTQIAGADLVIAVTVGKDAPDHLELDLVDGVYAKAS